MDIRRHGIEEFLKPFRNEYINIINSNELKVRNLNLPTYSTVYYGNNLYDAIKAINYSKYFKFIVQVRNADDLFCEHKTMDIDKSETIDYISKYKYKNTIYFIREFFNAKYSGTIRSNDYGTVIEMWEGNHYLNESITLDKVFIAEKNIDDTYFKFNHNNLEIKKIAINSLRFFGSISDLPNFYTEFIYNNKYVFIDYAINSFWYK